MADKLKGVVELAIELVEANKTIEAQRATIREQAAQISSLQEELEQARRAGKRQAHPFRRHKRKESDKHKKPGRKKGQGKFNHREKPTEFEQTKESPKLEQCQCCGSSALIDKEQHEHFQVDIPEIKPIVTRFTSETATCADCGSCSESFHPQQISKARGAAAVSLGPRAIATAADMHDHLGVSYGKIADHFTHLFQLPVSRSGLCQAVARLAKQAEPIYQKLVEAISQASVVHADETGWRIGILNAWLWVFSNKEITVYTIRSGEGARGHKVAVDILGDRFEGVLISDCLAVYDVEAFSQCIKQKCLNHFLTDLCPLREDTQAIVTAFANEAVQTLKQAIKLKKSKPKLDEQAYQQQCQAVEERLDNLLKEYAQLGNETAQRLVNRLNKQRKNLFTFLYQENVEPTNAQAERDLRPAVIARKTQACNKTPQGADNHCILSSIMSTARKQSVPIIELLEKVQRGNKPSLAPAPT